MLDDELHLLGDVGRVQGHPLGQSPAGLAGVHSLVFAQLLTQVVGGLVGHVVLKHVEDEPFLDGLTHRILVEGLRQVVLG